MVELVEGLNQRYSGFVGPAQAIPCLVLSDIVDIVDIFLAIKDLGFALGQYVVVGSGIMAAYGLKEAQDIDLVATPTLFAELERSGRGSPSRNPTAVPVWPEVWWRFFSTLNAANTIPQPMT